MLPFYEILNRTNHIYVHIQLVKIIRLTFKKD
jgi:hypothetical protein